MEIEDRETQFQPLAGGQGERKSSKKPNQQETESNNGGLFFKLMTKMPKPEPLYQNPAPPEFARICEVCNKGFSSGKALGGHMRMHVQANRELLLQSRKNKIQKPKMMQPNNNNSDVSSTNGGGGFLIEGNNNNSTNSNSNMSRPVCCVCGKNFPSKKSLYGHMRSHPEREWRGIQPPPTAAKNSSSSTLSDAVPQSNHKAHDHDQIDSAATPTGSKNSVVDLSKTLPGWSHTARRGRKSIGSSSAANSESVSGLDLSPGVDQEQMEEAVQDLMMLAKAIPCVYGKGKGAADQMCEATNSNFFITNNNNKNQTQMTDNVGSSNKRKGMEKKWYDEHGDGKGKGVLGGGFGQEKSTGKSFLKLGFMEEENKTNIEEELSGSDQNSESFVLASMRRRKRRKMKLVDLEGGDISVGAQSHHHQIKQRYKCSLCDKSFPSHQALGGHMSSHNKLKNNNNSNSIMNHSSMDDQSASADVSAAEDGVHADDQTETARPLDLNHHVGFSHQAHQAHHQCKICNKTFPTGQALGGHKRCHWAGPTEQQQLPAQPSQNVGRKVLNFDLNELPSMEEYEEGAEQHGGAAAGYATSSYNSVT